MDIKGTMNLLRASGLTWNQLLLTYKNEILGWFKECFAHLVIIWFLFTQNMWGIIFGSLYIILIAGELLAYWLEQRHR